MADYLDIAGRVRTTANDGVTAEAQGIKDLRKDKFQQDINRETDEHLAQIDSDLDTPSGGIKARLATLEAEVAFDGDFQAENTPQGIVSESGKIATANAVRGAIDVRTGYFLCETAAATTAKTVNATGFVLTNGGSMKIKMTNANTADNATLNINSTGANPLYYNGERVSANNTWEEGETVEVYYDGTNYYANNVAGGSSDGVLDVSMKYPTSGVEGGNTYTLEGALAVLNANLPASKKKGGMIMQFVLSSDNKYVRYRLMTTSFSTNEDDWQGVDETPTTGSQNLVTSGGVASAIKDTKIVDGSVETKAELSFVDEEYNCIAQFKDGEIKTKNFDSSTAATKTYVNTKVSTEIEEAINNLDFMSSDNFDNNEERLSIVDEAGECVVQFAGGHIKTKNFDSSNIDIDKNYPKIVIPNRIVAVVDDNLQIFYKSIINCPNYKNYGINAVCNIGRSMPRFYEVTPSVSDIGNHNLTICVYDNNEKVILTKIVTLEVVNKLSANVSPSKNVLTIGASTYANGNIISEVYRRFSLESGDGTPVNPTGLGISGINFIGRYPVLVSGETIYQEANAGWSWQKYATDSYKSVRFYVDVTEIELDAKYKVSGVAISSDYYFTVIGINEEDILCEPYGGYVYTELNLPSTGTLIKLNSSVQGKDNIPYANRVLESGNPFWNENKTGGAGIDFVNYSQVCCNGQSIDYIYTHLGLNGFTTKAIVDSQIEAYVKPFLRQFHLDYPNGKFILGTLQLGSPNGGYGYKGRANISANWFNLSDVYLYALKRYEDLSTDDEFSSYVYISSCTAEFDCEYGYPTTTINVNNRVALTEPIQSDSIHPTVDGHKMISDSIYRTLTKLLNN